MSRIGEHHGRGEKGDWRVWTGLALPPLSWATHHQISSGSNYAACGIGDRPLTACIGLLALAVCLTGGWLSWRAWRGGSEAPPARRFLPLLGLLVCGLFTLTLLMQLAATLIVPSCFR